MKQNNTRIRKKLDAQIQGQVVDTTVFASAVVALEQDGPMYKQLYGLFCQEMYKAVEKGRICTPERMAVLYPIFREINAEQEQVVW